MFYSNFLWDAFPNEPIRDQSGLYDKKKQPLLEPSEDEVEANLADVNFDWYEDANMVGGAAKKKKGMASPYGKWKEHYEAKPGQIVYGPQLRVASSFKPLFDMLGLNQEQRRVIMLPDVRTWEYKRTKGSGDNEQGYLMIYGKLDWVSSTGNSLAVRADLLRRWLITALPGLVPEPNQADEEEHKSEDEDEEEVPDPPIPSPPPAKRKKKANKPTEIAPTVVDDVAPPPEDENGDMDDGEWVTPAVVPAPEPVNVAEQEREIRKQAKQNKKTVKQNGPQTDFTVQQLLKFTLSQLRDRIKNPHFDDYYVDVWDTDKDIRERNKRRETSFAKPVRAWSDFKYYDALNEISNGSFGWPQFRSVYAEDAINLFNLVRKYSKMDKLESLRANLTKTNKDVVDLTKQIRALSGAAKDCRTPAGCIIGVLKVLAPYVPDTIWGNFCVYVKQVFVDTLTMTNTMSAKSSNLKDALRTFVLRKNAINPRAGEVYNRFGSSVDPAFWEPSSNRQQRAVYGARARQEREERRFVISRSKLMNIREALNTAIEANPINKRNEITKVTPETIRFAALLTVRLMMNTGLRRGDILSVSTAEPVRYDRLARTMTKEDAANYEKAENAVERRAARMPGGINTVRVMINNVAKKHARDKDTLPSLRYLLGGMTVEDVQRDLGRLRDGFFTDEQIAEHLKYWEDSEGKRPGHQGRPEMTAAEKAVDKAVTNFFPNVPDVHTHLLRGIYASETYGRYRRGEESKLAFIQRLFGHTTVETSMHYMYVKVAENEPKYDATTENPEDNQAEILAKLDKLSAEINKVQHKAANPLVGFDYRRKKRTAQQAADYVRNGMAYLKSHNLPATWNNLRSIGFGNTYIQRYQALYEDRTFEKDPGPYVSYGVNAEDIEDQEDEGDIPPEIGPDFPPLPAPVQ